jgi:hypothetical protein
MPKLRLAIVLPILMLCAAFPVMRWERHVQASLPSKREYPVLPTATLIYRGLNAPAVLFSTLCIEVLPIYRVDNPPPVFLGIAVNDFFFFGSVLVLWCAIGVLLDCSRVPKSPVHRGTMSKRVLVTSLLLLIAIVLFYAGLVPIQKARISANPRGDILEGALFLLWSAVIALFSVGRVAKGIRRVDKKTT